MSFGTVQDNSKLVMASEREIRSGPRSVNLIQKDFQCYFKATPRGDFNEFRRLRVSIQRTSENDIGLRG